MPTDVIMPQMGESIFEGTITKWLKKTGDAVQKDEPLFEISTDKVDAEIPSPVAGVLSEIKFHEGAIVQVNTVVGVVAENHGAPAVHRGKAAPPQPPEAQLAPPQVAQHSRAPEAQLAPPQVAQVVVMPQMGESIFEGTITKWLKKPGDAVQKDEPLFEISTDKVDAEIPSPIDGVLTEIRHAEGDTVQVNTVVAVIGAAASAMAVAAPAPVPASQARSPQPQAPKAQLAPPQVVPSQPGRRIRSSPLVRRIAGQNNIDLAQVHGTGSDGRITKEDIFAHLSHYGPGATASGAVAAQPQLAPPQMMSDAVVPLTRMRAIIAQRMSESTRTIPHAHTVYKVDMTRIARLRDRERAAFEQRHGVKLTYMPFIAAAAIEALRHHPILNASLVDSSIHYHAGIHLGVAVALDWGLIVPVIRHSETSSFVSLARSIGDLANRARARKLMPGEVDGATFTLTNSGAFGGEYGMPVINPPEAAILAIGGLRKEPAVLTDAEGNDTIAIRAMQHFCLGFDHRLIDGADSGKFMTEFKNTLETWNRPIG
jgi:2-oxoglutarate dehydrogenase E2 component (dihydrolipoamide succinyltransferase)